MIRSETIEAFWAEFCAETGQVTAANPYQFWYFGNSQDAAVELAELVMAGRKTATASLVAVNEFQPEVTPCLGGFSVVTDFQGNPKCVIRTEEVRIVPFCEVDAAFAFDEGEGDQTVEFWREAHHSYFSREAAEFGVDFGPESLVCCERFSLLYPR